MKHTLVAIVVAISLSACGHGAVTDGGTPVIPTGPDTTKVPGTVQRASLTLHVGIDPEDATVATTAGVTTSGVTVNLVRILPADATKLTAVSSANGTVKFDNLLDGIYRASVDRALTSTELARLTPADRDASIFAGGIDVPVSPPTNADAQLPLAATRRGSVIISEIFPFNSPSGQTIGYGMGDYLEVYNNSDTTAYLDGMLIFMTALPLYWVDPPVSCELNKSQRLDSTAVYVNIVQQFPGTGRQYPISPGQAKVIAMDAMDHNAAAPTMQQLNLSNADFEQHGSDADIDNPFVPDMTLLSGTGIFGRGYPYQSSPLAHGIALPRALQHMTSVDVHGTTGLGLGTMISVKRLPREDVVDIVGVRTVLNPNINVQYCEPFMSSVFERLPYPDINTKKAVAVSRKTAGHTADGREILRRTRASAQDFWEATPLKRSLAK